MANDVASFCFKENREYFLARKDANELLLPDEKILARNNEECFDIVLKHQGRKELFEKLLARRYKLLVSMANHSSPPEENCKVDFITTKKRSLDTRSIKVGEVSAARDTLEQGNEVSTQSFFMQPRMPAKLSINLDQLEILCERSPNGEQYVMTVKHGHALGAVETTVRLLKGVKFNLGETIKSLNDKKNTLGIPQTEFINSTGNESTIYELVVQ